MVQWMKYLNKNQDVIYENFARLLNEKLDRVCLKRPGNDKSGSRLDKATFLLLFYKNYPEIEKDPLYNKDWKCVAIEVSSDPKSLSLLTEQFDALLLPTMPTDDDDSDDDNSSDDDDDHTNADEKKKK